MSVTTLPSPPARGPATTESLGGNFRSTKTLEKTVREVLESLARLGYVASRDGRSFEIRRVA